MNIFIYLLFFVIGLVLIIKGSDWFVDSAVWFAKILKIPNLIIGATLVSVCTTLPEILVSTGSALRGNTSMAFGNAAGSVACNTGLIFSIILILAAPPLMQKSVLKIKTLTISLLLFICGAVAYFTSEITRFLGIGLFLLTFVYILFNYFQAKKYQITSPSTETVDTNKKNISKKVIFFVAGLVMTIAGAYLMIEYGVKIAHILEVPEIIIGVTMTALGTSLPELVTAITAVKKKAASLAIGNIFGANILNLTIVLGLAAMVKPIPADNNLLFFHLPVILLITLAAAFGTWFAYQRYSRITGIVLLCMYISYITVNVIAAF